MEPESELLSAIPFVEAETDIPENPNWDRSHFLFRLLPNDISDDEFRLVQDYFRIN